MVTPEQIAYFRTFRFLHCRGLLTPEETSGLIDAFERAMLEARDGTPDPHLEQDDNGYSAHRQQVAATDDKGKPFFDYDPDAFYWMLDDARFESYFSSLLGEDYVVGCTEGIIHAGGTGWHNDHSDGKHPDAFFSMRAHIYLDHLGREDGCLRVLPGSHHLGGYRTTLINDLKHLGVAPEAVPGAFPLINEPGDVIFLNHKTFHAALSARMRRRCIHINAYKPARTDDRAKLITALESHIHTDVFEVHHSAAKALKRINTKEALSLLEDYETRGPQRTVPWYPFW